MGKQYEHMNTSYSYLYLLFSYLSILLNELPDFCLVIFGPKAVTLYTHLVSIESFYSLDVPFGGFHKLLTSGLVPRALKVVVCLC